jgi:hypothetical protein
MIKIWFVNIGPFDYLELYLDLNSFYGLLLK